MVNKECIKIHTFKENPQSMIKRLLFVYFSFCLLSASAQLQLKGKVVDAQTQAPLSFGAVKIKHTTRGVLTNEDGVFQIHCKETDTLIFTYLSYHPKEIPAKKFNQNGICRLKVKENQLSTVLVNADEDYLYDLVLKTRKQLKKMPDYGSKTYFMLETESKGQPVEQIECYYNASLDGSGLKEMGLKNGRIGMAQFEDDYFVSLSTTGVLASYDLLSDKYNALPSNPLQMNKREMKRNYKLILIGLNGSKYRIKFKGKAKEEVFNGELWLDANENKLISISLKQQGLKKHPFIPLHEKHKLEDLNFELTYVFNQDNQKAEKMELAYELNYDNSSEVRPVKTNAIVLFYDHDSQFKLPFYEDETLLSDYDKIVARPYNDVFWDHNEVLLPSEKVNRYRAFFETNGVLLNFDNLSRHYEQFTNRKRPWSTDRIFRDELNLTLAQTGVYYRGVKFTRPNRMDREFEYKLNAQIFLDINVIDDSLHFITSTLIDLDKSFYSLNPDRYTSFFINSFFDLVEIHRQKLDDRLRNAPWNLEDIDKIYADAIDQLHEHLFTFRLDMLGRENPQAVEKYSQMIERELGINNRLLVLPIIQKDFVTGKKEYTITVANEKYFYALNLMEDGQYEKSIQMFMKYAEEGEHHQWLYLNLGKNYYALEEYEKACQFFDLYQSFGGTHQASLMEDCVSND